MAASGGIGRIPEGEEGLGSPLPHHCFVLGRAVTSQDFINILIVYSWPHSGPNECIILLLKEAIVAWSPWGQQWPGSAHHFLPPPPAPRQAQPPSGEAQPQLLLFLCLSLSFWSFLSFSLTPPLCANIGETQLKFIPRNWPDRS